MESIQRNLQMALPEILGELRASPENIAITFKLYHNLDALYDVLGPVVESAGALEPRMNSNRCKTISTLLSDRGETWPSGWRAWPAQKKEN